MCTHPASALDTSHAVRRPVRRRASSTEADGLCSEAHFSFVLFLFVRPAYLSYGFFYAFFVMATHFDRRTHMRVPGAHARRGANFVRTVSATPTAGTVGIETAPPSIATRDSGNQLTKGEKAGVIIGVVLFFAIIGT